MNKIRLDCAVVVEGKYDKIKLSSFLDALIVETNGFSIFRDREKMELIRQLAQTRGIVILTDSDAAGFSIRSRIRGAIHEGTVLNAYIPDILGKERRKEAPSKEGKLGVEGMTAGILMDSLRAAGVPFENECCPQRPDGRQITKMDLFEDGLSGTADSKHRRQAFLKAARLPERLSANMMPDVLNAIMTFDEYKNLLKTLEF